MHHAVGEARVHFALLNAPYEAGDWSIAARDVRAITRQTLKKSFPTLIFSAFNALASAIPHPQTPCDYCLASPEGGFEVDRSFGMEGRQPAWRARSQGGRGQVSPGTLPAEASQLRVREKSQACEAKRTSRALPPGA